jgi:hypothetical protein
MKKNLRPAGFPDQPPVTNPPIDAEAVRVRHHEPMVHFVHIRILLFLKDFF